MALGEALINARFALMTAALERVGAAATLELLPTLELRFRRQQYLAQLATLAEVIRSYIPAGERTAPIGNAVDEILRRMEREVDAMFQPGATRKSDFFRDLAGSSYLRHAEELARSQGVPFDRLVGLFDKAILDVENRPAGADNFGVHTARRAGRVDARAARARSRGGGGGIRADGRRRQCRHRLRPCHASRSRRNRSAPRSSATGSARTRCFPRTRTVLDIGGQDTKAIQVDERGIVTSFQMNDRCAAGCGRYLGYIADEMNLGLHELGPMACQSSRPVRINSTCTVFAGAELRERLSLGEKREDILAGLHRAIILRAMSLLARSGGVSDEFTFTGGVARNPAAVGALRTLIRENYGEVSMNISPDSIYTGALGAALFARREATPAQHGGEAGKAREAA